MIAKVVFTVVLMIALKGYGGGMNLLSFYTVNYSVQSPVINGKIDDSCWNTAGIYSTYYVYNKTVSEPGKLKTQLRMLWNEKGLFLGIINYDKNMSAIKTKYTTRDSSNLWRDDCAELYFDSSGAGVGFTKFIVNAIGTVADMKRVDAAVFLPEWSSSGVEIITSQDKGAWYIEAFFPWSDLGQEAVSGALWRFCHVRYAWSSGSFIGVSSSLGGSYSRPENFGFIYFSKNNNPSTKEVGGVLRNMATQPWSLPINNGLLVCSNGTLKFSNFLELYSDNYTVAEKLLQQIENAISRLPDINIDNLKYQLAELQELDNSDIDIIKLRAIQKMAEKLDELYWKQKLDNLLRSSK